MSEMSYKIEDRTIVHYRRVINDAVCTPWVPMPEVQPANLEGLINFLKKCSHNRDFFGNFWAPERLRFAGMFEDDEHYLAYGDRQQFFIPEPISRDNEIILSFTDDEDQPFNCPYCGEKMYVDSTQFGLIGNETYYRYTCPDCTVNVGCATTVHELNRWMLKLEIMKKGMKS